MKYIYLRSSPGSAAVLRSVSIIRTELLDGQSPVFYYPCSTRVFLCFFVQGDRPVKLDRDGIAEYALPEAVVIGPQLSAFRLHFGAGGLCVVAEFCPGGFQQLTGIPVSTLVGRQTDAASLLGKEIALVTAALRQNSVPERMAVLVDTFLQRRAGTPVTVPLMDKAIDTWIRHHGNIPVEQVAAMACLSPRQFARRCEERLGLRPKLFARLTRFAEAYQLKELHPHWKWTRIAHELGYHDQMHLVHDFKTFAGLTPTRISQPAGWFHLPVI